MQTLSLQQADVIRILQSRNARRVIWLLNILLVIWIASRVATLTWDLLAPTEPADPVAVVAESVPAPSNPDRQLISQLPGWHLMGVTAKGSAPVQTSSAPVDAPDTKLKLVLRGLYSSDDLDKGHAIIADPRGKEEQYSIGDMLPGNAELSEVHADKVILQRGGRYETLRLPKDDKPGNTVSSRNASPSRSVSTRSSSSPAQRLKQVRENMRKRPRDLYNLVRATPKKDAQGKIIGYELGVGRDPELFKQAGLQKGDVAIQINDIKLDNPANSARALKSAQSGETVSVTVLRNGQEEVLSLSVPE
ncbi:MAG TPA: type II secretion system protein GspC [Gammaproteobacteria bacterium]|nr:type II secretion system protein GspC [Gammaproteobacteria bacterium]